MAYRETQIDETFPVAGVDNESQGFRDNFSAIKDTLVQAKGDILQLQTDRLNILDEETDLSGNTISNLNLKNATFEYNAGGNVIASQNIDFTNGAYQVFTLAKSSPSAGSPITFNFVGFPAAGKYGNLRVHLYGNSSTQYFEFTSETAGTFVYSEDTPTELSVTSASEPLVFDISTFDGGDNVFVKYLGSFSSTLSPFRLRNVDTVTRDALSADFGAMIYNTDTNTFQGYQNTGGDTPEWVNLS